MLTVNIDYIMKVSDTLTRKKKKKTTANERFCEMAGATRPKFLLTLQRQWLVRAAVNPATSQSHRPVG
jgi:hypothetical protein